MDRPIIPPDPTKGPAVYAPPLDAEKLATYRQIATDCSREDIRDVMLSLIAMVAKFLKTPPSKLPGVPLRTAYTKRAKKPVEIVPLEQEEVNRMWDEVPYPHEIEAMRALFFALPEGTMLSWEEEKNRWKTIVIDQAEYDLRNAALHLVWYAKELSLDREPMTKDRIA